MPSALSGLSFETCGRECDFVTPSSASSRATGFEVIDEPRSACRVNCSRVMPSRAHYALMNFSVKAVDTYGVII